MGPNNLGGGGGGSIRKNQISGEVGISGEWGVGVGNFDKTKRKVQYVKAIQF